VDTEASIDAKPIIRVFFAAAGELKRLNAGLSKWQWVHGSEQDHVSGAEALIVFARRHHEDEAVALCKQLRESRRADSTPILLAINMYQMPFGNRVRDLPMAHFILTPIRGEELEQRLKNLKKSDSGE
jgi:response regulator RpfG family c-di-GMP phosphodiesterase